MPREAKARAPDPLSDVLGTLNLRGDVFARTEAASPWAIEFPRGDARFHLVERGTVWAHVEGVKNAVRANEGDLLVLPHGAPHTLGDRAGPGWTGCDLNGVFPSAPPCPGQGAPSP